MTPKTLRIGMAGLGLLASLTGCGGLMNGDHQSVTIFSTPPEVKVTIDDFLHVTAPGTVSLSRKADHMAYLEKEGFEPTTIKLERTWSWWIVGDLACLLFVFNCISSDRHDGGYYTFDDEIHVTLAPRVSVESPKPAAP